jgi:hypothetical protein
MERVDAILEQMLGGKPRPAVSDREREARAAKRALVFAGGHEGRILRALLEHPWKPLDAKMIGQLTGLSNVQVCRRLGKKGHLRSDGWVRLVEGEGEQRFEAIIE